MDSIMRIICYADDENDILEKLSHEELLDFSRYNRGGMIIFDITVPDSRRDNAGKLKKYADSLIRM